MWPQGRALPNKQKEGKGLSTEGKGKDLTFKLQPDVDSKHFN